MQSLRDWRQASRPRYKNQDWRQASRPRYKNQDWRQASRPRYKNQDWRQARCPHHNILDPRFCGDDILIRLVGKDQPIGRGLG